MTGIGTFRRELSVASCTCGRNQKRTLEEIRNGALRLRDRAANPCIVDDSNRR